MRILSILCLTCSLVLAQGSYAGEEVPADALHLGEHRSEVRLITVERLESAPVQFEFAMEVAMPEPMWRLTVDSVGEPDGLGRIQVRLSGTRPEGNLPQVITMTRVRVPLGALPVGDYLVDVFVERSPHPHRRVGALMLRASR